MLKKKIRTAYRLFREGGVKKVHDYAWLRLQVLAKGHKPEVRLDRCTFSLAAIADASTRIELITRRYEAPERRLVARYIKRTLPVVELGGSMGVVACVTNKLLKDPSAHVVIEANPLAVPLLELNKKLNRSQFEIVNQAIAYGAASVTFHPSSNLCESSITVAGDQPAVSVPATQLCEVVRQRGFSRFNLVCDIEGLEYDLVCHEAEALKNAAIIIMETHARFIGEEKISFTMSRLEQLGFRIVEKTGFVVVLER
jgi:FkbM family methyltransferase